MSASDNSKIPGGGTGDPSPMVIDVPVHQQRSLATVTAEIRTIRAARDKMFLEASVEIGRRLKEAKELVGHGGWGDYCKTELDFSQQTAQNHIKLFEAYAAEQIRLDGAALKSQAFGNLSYTQALALLALPSEEEREEFVESHDMGSLSTRDLQAEISRLREEKAAAEVLASDARIYAEEKEAVAEDLAGRLPALQREKEAAEAAQKAAEADKKLLAKEKNRAEKEAKAAKKELDEARKNPQVPQEVLDRLKREAEAAAKQDADNSRIAAVQAAREEADKQCLSLQQEKEALEKELALAAPALAVFRDRFTRLQADISALIVSVEDLPEDKQEGARKGLRAILQNGLGLLEENQEDNDKEEEE